MIIALDDYQAVTLEIAINRYGHDISKGLPQSPRPERERRLEALEGILLQIRKEQERRPK